MMYLCIDALMNMEGDEIMVEIYETVQDEIRMKTKQLEKEKRKVRRKFVLFNVSLFNYHHCTEYLPQ